MTGGASSSGHGPSDPGPSESHGGLYLTVPELKARLKAISYRSDADLQELVTIALQNRRVTVEEAHLLTEDQVKARLDGIPFPSHASRAVLLELALKNGRVTREEVVAHRTNPHLSAVRKRFHGMRQATRALTLKTLLTDIENGDKLHDVIEEACRSFHAIWVQRVYLLHVHLVRLMDADPTGAKIRELDLVDNDRLFRVLLTHGIGKRPEKPDHFTAELDITMNAYPDLVPHLTALPSNFSNVPKHAAITLHAAVVRHLTKLHDWVGDGEKNGRIRRYVRSMMLGRAVPRSLDHVSPSSSPSITHDREHVVMEAIVTGGREEYDSLSMGDKQIVDHVRGQLMLREGEELTEAHLKLHVKDALFFLRHLQRHFDHLRAERVAEGVDVKKKGVKGVKLLPEPSLPAHFIDLDASTMYHLLYLHDCFRPSAEAPKRIVAPGPEAMAMQGQGKEEEKKVLFSDLPKTEVPIYLLQENVRKHVGVKAAAHFVGGILTDGFSVRIRMEMEKSAKEKEVVEAKKSYWQEHDDMVWDHALNLVLAKEVEQEMGEEEGQGEEMMEVVEEEEGQGEKMIAMDVVEEEEKEGEEEGQGKEGQEEEMAPVEAVVEEGQGEEEEDEPYFVHEVLHAARIMAAQEDVIKAAKKRLEDAWASYKAAHHPGAKDFHGENFPSVVVVIDPGRVNIMSACVFIDGKLVLVLRKKKGEEAKVEEEDEGRMEVEEEASAWVETMAKYGGGSLPRGRRPLVFSLSAKEYHTKSGNFKADVEIRQRRRHLNLAAASKNMAAAAAVPPAQPSGARDTRPFDTRAAEISTRQGGIEHVIKKIKLCQEFKSQLEEWSFGRRGQYPHARAIAFRLLGQKDSVLDRFFVDMKKSIKEAIKELEQHKEDPMDDDEIAEMVEEAMLVWGAAKFSPTGRGTPAVPTHRSYLRARLHFANVILGDEFRTSITDAEDGSILTKIKCLVRTKTKILEPKDDNLQHNFRHGMLKGLSWKRLEKRIEKAASEGMGKDGLAAKFPTHARTKETKSRLLLLPWEEGKEAREKRKEAMKWDEGWKEGAVERERWVRGLLASETSRMQLVPRDVNATRLIYLLARLDHAGMKRPDAVNRDVHWRDRLARVRLAAGD